MTKGRWLFAFLIALVISGACTLLLNRRIARAKIPVAARKQYMAAAAPLKAGQVLKAGDIRTISWPAAIPLSGGFADNKPLIGRAVLYPLAANEPILNRDLAMPGAGLTAKIPSGMRALALRSDEVVGVAGFLFPGSHVDVLVTYRSVRTSEPATATVLQDAEVLAAGHQVEPDPSGKPATVNVVTLLVKPEDAERVVLASAQGTIHFVLRNGGDSGHVDGAPVELSQLIPDAAAKPLPVARKPRPRREQTYTVETVLGNKQTSTSFD